MIRMCWILVVLAFSMLLLPGQVRIPGPGGTASSAGGGLPVTDTFSSGSALSGSWTVVSGTWNVASGVASASANGAATSYARYTGATFPNNQYAKANVVVAASAKYPMVCVRTAGTSGATFDGYCFQREGTTGTSAYLLRFDDGGETTLTSCTATWTEGDTIHIVATGTTIQGYRNGTFITGCQSTDATYSAGTPAIGAYAGETPVPTFDNFEAGS